MTIKQFVKKVIGQNNTDWIKQHLKFLRDSFYLKNHSRIRVEAKELLYQKFSQKNKHVFFGYFDIPQVDNDEKRMLVHVVKSNADTKKDCIELGYYNIDTCEYFPFASSHAWCWQQGSRLRWHPSERNVVLFNDLQDDQYITRMFNIDEKKEMGSFCAALYDISPDMSYGLSLNFSRLQRLRPGYGYNTLTDQTNGIAAPEDDGIFYVDLQTNQKSLLIRLSELAADVDDPQADEHYINHISISPDGKHFMFFHIWTLKGDTHWKTRLCIYDLESRKMKILEDRDRVSHYDWINNHKLLVTCWDKMRNQYYCVYDIETGNKIVLEHKSLCHDGHPTIISGGESFISDTYPMNHDMQLLFEYNLKNNLFRPIIQLYSDALQYEEKRCDLHPRISKSERYITVDTTCENRCRQIMLLQNWRV